MYKKIGVKKLGRPAGERNALIKSQLRDLIERGHIKTTKAKAKVVMQKLDQMVVKVLENNFKEVNEYFGNQELSQILSKYNFGERKNGFASMVSIKSRAGDKAELVLVELLVK
jgi:ribosomal protein L17